MARIRTIKPEFWKNETLGELGSDAQLLFIGLWNLCDRRGFVEHRPKRIKAELFPYRDFDITAMINLLKDQKDPFIRIIEHNGIEFIHVLNFGKHQVINVKEPESNIPEEYWHCANTVPAQCQHSADTQGREGKGKEGKGYAREEIFNILKSVDPLLITDDEKRKRYAAIESEMRNWSSWHDQVSIAIRKPQQQVKKMILTFLNNIKADNDYFKDINEIKRHFRNWANKQPIENETNIPVI